MSFPQGHIPGGEIVRVRGYMSRGYRCRLLQLREQKLNARGQCWKVTFISVGSLLICNLENMDGAILWIGIERRYESFSGIGRASELSY